MKISEIQPKKHITPVKPMKPFTNQHAKLKIYKEKQRTKQNTSNQNKLILEKEADIMFSP